jgi:hypothetical protein
MRPRYCPGIYFSAVSEIEIYKINRLPLVYKNVNLLPLSSIALKYL